MKKLLFFSIVTLFSISLASQDSTNICLKTTNFHIVVIGSSTASGAGASTSDSAWVNRYRNHIQDINPTNLVTNLAIGGTTTYHIMPSWYTAPSNRPSHNNNNVTQAINLGADAIILNMPSNDAANGFGVNEQMFNFRTIVNYADSFNVPVFVCTTQPKANFPLWKDSIQVAVRDSVLAVFGNHALDFWTTLATSNNKLDSTYDAGDGTHLNDKGHGLLFARVSAKNILTELYTPTSYTDVSVVDARFLPTNQCGDSLTTWTVTMSNSGPANTPPSVLTSEIFDYHTGQTNMRYDTIYNMIGTCDLDTLSIKLNTWNGAHISIKSYLQSFDSIPQNDTSSQAELQHFGRPNLYTYSDTVCMNTVAQLQAVSTDPIRWYSSMSQNSPIGAGYQFYTDPLSQTTSYWAEAVRGPFYYEGSLAAASSSNINWNGVMFNLIAKDTLVLDSLSFSSPDVGVQGILAQIRYGGYEGFEDSASAWNLWGADVKQISVAGEEHFADFGSLTMYPNDTLGVYLSMLNSSSRLGYRSASSTQIFSNSELDVVCGSGKAYNFGATYPNRQWKGTVCYHFGYNPQGQCTSERVPVKAVVDQPVVNLGMDTIVQSQNTTLNLDAGAGYSNYLWSTGDTTQTISLMLTQDWVNYSLLMVQVRSKFGCVDSDTIVLHVIPLEINDEQEVSIKIYPNPTSDILFLEMNGFKFQEDVHVRIFNSSGALISSFMGQKQQKRMLNLSDLSSGLYWLDVSQSGVSLLREKIIVSK